MQQNTKSKQAMNVLTINYGYGTYYVWAIWENAFGCERSFACF